MAQPKTIPEGYHALQPSLPYEDAAKAIAFYEKAFGGREVRRTPGPGGKIAHAEVQLGDSRLFVNDVLPGKRVELPSPARPCPASLVLYVPDVDATWKQAVAAGAKELMGGLMDQFWGDRGGFLLDPFGYQWFVASRVRVLTDDEIRRAQEQLLREQARRAGAAP